MKAEISESEAAIVDIVRLNELEKTNDWRFRRRIGRLEVTFEWRAKSSLWGRFGGGWNWQFGFQASGKTIIFRLLVCSLFFSIKDRGHDAPDGGGTENCR